MSLRQSEMPVLLPRHGPTAMGAFHHVLQRQNIEARPASALAMSADVHSRKPSLLSSWTPAYFGPFGFGGLPPDGAPSGAKSSHRLCGVRPSLLIRSLLAIRCTVSFCRSGTSRDRRASSTVSRRQGMAEAVSHKACPPISAYQCVRRRDSRSSCRARQVIGHVLRKTNARKQLGRRYFFSSAVSKIFPRSALSGRT
jgi:hypothetical protein